MDSQIHKAFHCVLEKLMIFYLQYSTVLQYKLVDTKALPTAEKHREKFPISHISTPSWLAHIIYSTGMQDLRPRPHSLSPVNRAKMPHLSRRENIRQAEASAKELCFLYFDSRAHQSQAWLPTPTRCTSDAG